MGWVGRERKGGGRPGYTALLVPGGGCLSRAWLPEKPGQRRRKAASHDLGAGRRWASRREGEAEKSISPLPLLPTTTHQSEKNKYISLFSGPALHIYPPFPPPRTNRTGPTETKGEVVGDTATSPGASLQRGLGAWVSRRQPRNAKGGGFSGLPSPVPLSSNQAQPPPSTPAPLGQGTRTTCLQPPPPPLGCLAWRAQEPGDRLPPALQGAGGK